jgi:putative hemolysin
MWNGFWPPGNADDGAFRLEKSTRLTQSIVLVGPSNFVSLTKESIRLLVGASAQYTSRLACSAEEIRAAQVLRFEIFNLELNEGLPQSYTTGLDADPYDAVCDHLIVEHIPSHKIVGTYRLQTGGNAAEKLGYYCAQEFDFGVYEPWRKEIVELGRACVHRQHRNLVVLGLLWKGIAAYAKERGGRYLIGCSSLTSQDPAVGTAAYQELCRKNLAPAPWRTQPLPAYACPIDPRAGEHADIPKLLRAYLTIGAKICGPPAMDRQFKTIDFLTLLDIEKISASARLRFLS